jgi:hypothetical protein
VPFFHDAGGLQAIFWFIVFVQLAALAGFFLAVLLVTALIPRRLERIASAIPERWGWALLTGVLTYAGCTVAAIILFITFIGIPLGIAVCFALMVIKWIGLASLFLLIGQRLGRNLFKRDLAHLPAVLGGFVVYAILWLVPLFGWAVSQFLDFLAVGMVLLTRFGSEEPWGRQHPPSPQPAPQGPPGVPIASPSAGQTIAPGADRMGDPSGP